MNHPALIRHRWEYPLVMHTVPNNARIAIRSKCGKELMVPAGLVRMARAHRPAFDESRALCEDCD